jgi:hypothetical protein
MKNHVRIAIFTLTLSLPAFCLTQALIVHDPSAGGAVDASITANLTTELASAGYTVTANIGVPAGSLTGYQQIWDVRHTSALNQPEIAAYIAYMAGGGNLFVLGENQGFFARNGSIVDLVNQAGGGQIGIMSPASNTQIVFPPFTGPNSLSSITFLSAGAAVFPPGNGASITQDSSYFSSGVWFGRGAMTKARAGSLAIVLDANFMDPSSSPPAGSQALLDNLIQFLAAPVAAPAPFPTDFQQVGVLSNLLIGDSYVNVTNTGTRNGFDPAGGVCANFYAFDPSEELISCCSCYITPDGLRSLSAKLDLVSNTLTPGVPGSVVIKTIASRPMSGSTCNAALPTFDTAAPGLRAWGTSLHQNTVRGRYEMTENVFQSSPISSTELTKLTVYCGFIQSNGSGFGICRSCRLGALGGAQQ